MTDDLLKNDPLQMNRLEQAMLWFFGGAFVFFLFNYGIRPIHDPDFWWHLKTGEFMVQNGGLLQSDPFNFTGDGVVSAIEAVILKGYWLWQIIAYGLFSLFGFNGIFLLNFLTIGAMAAVVILEMRRQGVEYPLAIFLLTIGFFFVSVTYALERPHVVSFLFAAILLTLFSRVRDGGQFGWMLPLLMMVWANMHGGFVVGDILLLCFLVGAVMEYRQDLSRLRHIILWVGIGIGASLLNPNGALVFGELINFSNSPIGEFQSTWVKFQQGNWLVIILWLLIALYGVGIWCSRRLYWPELIVSLFLAYSSVSYIRNVGFFTVAMLPVIGGHFQEGARRRQFQMLSYISVLLLTLCSTLFIWLSYTLWQGRQGVGPVKLIYPEAAITFLHDSGLQGRMFNDYTYGGYLLWRLSPQIKIFIDGRGLEQKVFSDYTQITAASTTWVDGRREYEGLLDRYAIDYVIQPIYDGNGRLQPLMKSLLDKPEWAPIYLDATVYILARLTPANAESIRAYRIDNREFKTRLLLILNYIHQSNPQEIGYQIARAGMLTYMAMYDEAKAQVEAIAAAAPTHPSLPVLERELAILRAKRVRQ